MKHNRYINLIIALLTAFVTSCSENDPESLSPLLVLEDAGTITRYTAILKGSASVQNDKTSIKTLRFRYGDTAEMLLTADCDNKTGDVSTTLQKLNSGTKYYYCLEAGNEYSKVQSETRTFTTLFDNKPQVSGVNILSQGPISVVLQFNIPDNGGKPVTEAGVYYQYQDGEKQALSLPSPTGTVIRKRIEGLKTNTTYTVWGYAKNEIGETLSEPIQFKTTNVTQVSQAGMLEETIGDNYKYQLTSLSVTGSLNGSDLRFIRDMAGKDIQDNDTQGQLADINLADAHIVSGGDSYNASRFTTKDIIGFGMFKDCTKLRSIILPDDTKAIEENAFQNCSSLTSIQIPAGAESILPSTGCTSLSSLTVSGANTNYSSVDGVLYDKAVSTIIWFPQGKNDTSFILPSTIKTLGSYAFQSCKLRSVVLPSAITTIPYGVFSNCVELTSVTLGSGTSLISQYCFKGCPLKELHVKASPFPPSCSDESFAGVTNIYSTCTLYVPKGYKATYRASSHWGQFTKIVEE